MRDAAISPVLATTVCPNCAYSLIGLANDAACPECGRVQDPDEVILYGWARGRHETFGNARPARMIYLTLLSVIVVFFQYFPLLTDRRGLLFGAAIVIVPMIFFYVRRRETAHPGFIQVRVNPRGCLQVDDLAGGSIARELGPMLYGLGCVAWAAWLIIGRRSGEVSDVAFWFGLPTSIFFVGVFIWAQLRLRAAARKLREGSIADANAAHERPTAWDKIKDFSLKPVKGGNYRLRIIGFAKFWNNDEVDAVIKVSDEQAVALTLILGKWWTAARQKADGPALRLTR